MRKVGLSTLAAAASFIIGWGLLQSLSGADGPGSSAERLSRITADLILSLGVLAAAWYFLTALGTCVAGVLRLLGAAPRRFEGFLARFGAPLLRRIATWTAVSTIALGSPALAGTESAHSPGTDSPVSSSTAQEVPSRNSAALVDLGWGEPAADPAPEATRGAEAGASESTATEDGATTSSSRAAPAEHVVQVGDTLWAIAEADLHRTAETVTSEEIAAHWPRWYAANAPVIGPDPHRILPGMTLHAPTSEAT